MKLIIASNNEHKIREITQILGGFFEDICSMREAGIDIDIVEDGATFEENAAIKASAISAMMPDCAVLADDSGLMVDALGGAPGVLSARYAGEGHNDADNNNKLMRAMESVEDELRGCKFVCCIALRKGRETISARGECAGILARAPRGENGFGYDPLFYLPELKKTFAQLTPKEKNSISHRARALLSMRDILEGLNNE